MGPVVVEECYHVMSRIRLRLNHTASRQRNAIHTSMVMGAALDIPVQEVGQTSYTVPADAFGGNQYLIDRRDTQREEQHVEVVSQKLMVLRRVVSLCG